MDKKTATSPFLKAALKIHFKWKYENLHPCTARERMLGVRSTLNYAMRGASEEERNILDSDRIKIDSFLSELVAASDDFFERKKALRNETEEHTGGVQ